MKNRTIRRTVAATAIALCATTTVVACGSDDSTGDGGVGALTGDDARAEGDDDSKDNGGHGGSKPEDRVKEIDAPLHYAGDEVEFTGGEKYEYDDGRTEFGKNAFKYGITIDNLRKVETMTEPDPDAPADHPDSKSQLDAVYLCYDITARIIDDPNKGTDDELYALDSIPSAPITQPQWDGYVNDFDTLESAAGAVRVNPGEDHPEILPRTEEEFLKMQGDMPTAAEREEQKRIQTQTSCFVPDASGKEKVKSVPDDLTGVSVSYLPRSIEPDQAYWSLKLDD